MKSAGERRASASLPILSAIVFAGGLATFLLITHRAVSDFGDQAAFLAWSIEHRFVPAAFLFYLAVAIVTAFSTSKSVILVGFSVVLAVAVTAKYIFSVRALFRWSGLERPADRGWRLPVLMAGVGLLLAFCLPLPGQNWYLGQFPPNLWHNATIIAMMPFGVLLFLSSVEFLRDGNPRRLWSILLFVVLNLLTKPSLFICFVVVFPILALHRFGLSRTFYRACLVVAAGAAIIFVQYLVIYHDPDYDEMARLSGAGGATLELGWLHVWRLYSENIPLSLLNSLLLPTAFLAAYPRTFLRDDAIRFSGALLIVGLLIFATVYETGERELHGTYSFQNPAANYLVHLAVMAAFVRLKLGDGAWRLRDHVLLGAFLLEVGCGVLYLVRYVQTGTYL